MLMAAAVMHEQGRLVKPKAETQLFGLPDKAMSSIGGVTGREGEEHYPTHEEAQFAKESGGAYGKSWERYFNDQITKVYGESGQGGWRPESLFLGGQTHEEVFRRFMEEGDPRVVDLAATKNPRFQARFKDLTARAALAAGRDPIASLGFDPSAVVHDVMSRAGSLGGFTMQGYKGKPTKDIPVASNRASDEDINAAPSNVVHESIHRGFEKLTRTNPEAVAEFRNVARKFRNAEGKQWSGGPEELLTRYIMATTMGDPEPKSGKQREDALEFLKDPEVRDSLIKLQAMAAKQIAKQHPGGPR
jgi:hypothetical protein